MTNLRRIAFIGNSLPRRCGIATFTTALENAVSGCGVDLETSIVAMTDHGQEYDYPTVVRHQIRDDKIDDYVNAAEYILNPGEIDVVCLQHEFGIFGGEAGVNIMALLSRLTMPIVTTLHTVLATPTPAQRDVLERVVTASARVIVMAEKGRDLLRTVYRVPEAKIKVVPHGVPDCAFAEPDEAKAALGFAGRPVILTFGLLSPNKGIETVIDAMPAILQRCPTAVYVVLGATHPNLVRDHGEAYRHGLIRRAQVLGVADHVVFHDRFVDQATLLTYISMCDVYVTPYLKEAQMTSGTLAYSFGLGRAIVSTPYWHASELLANDRGILVPFADATAIGDGIASLLTDEPRRRAMREQAYAISRSMTWERTAERYLSIFEAARLEQRPRVVARQPARTLPRPRVVPPDLQIEHLLSMCDDTGLFQHAIHSVPDRAHGYCVDDNARALLLACTLNGAGEIRLPEALVARFAAFVQHAWNPDTRYFRNFMSFDRRWLEDRGSEDSHGRTLWALGECARRDSSPSRRCWAAALFAEAMGTVERFGSPRAWAFTLLGLDGYCAAVPDDAAAQRLRRLLADRLIVLMGKVETEGWVWFEEGLSYDNARLPQALIVTGAATAVAAYRAAGLRSLRWLIRQQTSPVGHFRPVGTEGFADRRLAPRVFDQQPVEAAATISACLAAWRADGEGEWRAEAGRAFGWFLGHNDLSVPLVDSDTGSCRDGLHPDRANENRGGESVVSYLLGLQELRQLASASGRHAEHGQLRALHA